MGVINNYDIHETIGEGAYGIVLRGRNKVFISNFNNSLYHSRILGIIIYTIYLIIYSINIYLYSYIK